MPQQDSLGSFRLRARSHELERDTITAYNYSTDQAAEHLAFIDGHNPKSELAIVSEHRTALARRSRWA